MNRKHLSYVSFVAIALLGFVVASCGGSEESAAADEPADAVSEAPEPAADTKDDNGEDGTERAEPADASAADETPFATAEAIGMTLAWRIAGTELEVELTGPTTGWIAVGFEPSRAMKDANILIGYVDGDDAVMTDQFGTTMVAHRRDQEIGGSRDVLVISGSETGGETTIRFAVPLDSGDEYDQPLAAGETARVILAYGPDGADDTQTYHEDRAGLDIDL
jgi:hypothetical protein